ncbi:hypothetical protein LXL04_007676 [Taraxacum kok-saghyz]
MEIDRAIWRWGGDDFEDEVCFKWGRVCYVMVELIPTRFTVTTTATATATVAMVAVGGDKFYRPNQKTLIARKRSPTCGGSRTSDGSSFGAPPFPYDCAKVGNSAVRELFCGIHIS